MRDAYPPDGDVDGGAGVGVCVGVTVIVGGLPAALPSPSTVRVKSPIVSDVYAVASMV